VGGIGVAVAGTSVGVGVGVGVGVAVGVLVGVGVRTDVAVGVAVAFAMSASGDAYAEGGSAVCVCMLYTSRTSGSRPGLVQSCCPGNNRTVRSDRAAETAPSSTNRQKPSSSDVTVNLAGTLSKVAEPSARRNS
jgi:hypothetical protein